MIVYYIDGEKFTTDDWNEMSLDDISSPNENTPAIENLETEYKFWCKKGFIRHRLTGPASINFDGEEYFYLNDKCYETILDWLKHHSNSDLYFDAIGLSETERVLWYLKN